MQVINLVTKLVKASRCVRSLDTRIAHIYRWTRDVICPDSSPRTSTIPTNRAEAPSAAPLLLMDHGTTYLSFLPIGDTTGRIIGWPISRVL